MTDNVQSMGGKARAKALSDKERRRIAEEAAAKRWGIPKATHRGVLKIGDMEIPCYVLENGKRVLSQRGMIGGLGMGAGADRLASFLGGKVISPYVSGKLTATIQSPLKFMAGSAGLAYGYEASLLTDICDSILEARKSTKLQAQQLHIAEQAEILVRGFARVGIIALVDEATGYQEIRDRHALQAILDQYLRKELAAWAKTFPDEFYQEIFRLRGWEWKGIKVNRPQCVANYTKDIVYARLAPNIIHELEAKNPADENGNRKAKHHQWLSDDVGHPALAQHLHAVTHFMKAADSWDTFKRLLDRAFPRKGDTLLLPMNGV